MQELNFHPIAAIFPLIEGQEFSALVDDVRKHGVREPIWLYDGQILDGRNRYKAAQEAGVSFEIRMFEGTPVEAIERVWSLNRTRRHMTPSQAAIADARRNEMTDVYATVREAAKERRSATLKQNATVVEQIPQRDAEHEPEQPAPGKTLLSQNDKSVETPAPKTRDTRAKAAGTNAKYIDLANKDDLAKIGAAKRVESGKETGRGNKKVLSQNDKTFEEPKHNTQAAIAKAANTSTGMIGLRRYSPVTA